MRAFVFLALFCPALVWAEEPKVVIMPVWGPRPPPQDPTFLRATRELAETIHGAIGQEVQVYSRDKRAELCADNGHECPSEIARMLDVAQVIELSFDEKMEQLRIQVWGRPRGLLREGKVDCPWADGRPRCDHTQLAQIVSGDGLAPLDPATVERALDALMPKLEACKTKRSAKKKAKHPVDVTLRFRVTPSGRVREVRVDPKELQNLPAWACVSRQVETLRVPPFRGEQALPFSRVIGQSQVVQAP